MSRKSPSKDSRKAAQPTLVTKRPVVPLDPSYRRSIKMRSAQQGSGVKMVRVWGDFGDDQSDIDWSNVPRMPNPMPDNIVSLLKLAGEATWLAIPLAPYIYLLINSWFEGRNSRRLRVKNGDVEIEVQGAWSERTFRKQFDRFRKMTKDLAEDDIQILENGKVIKGESRPIYEVKEVGYSESKGIPS